MVSISVFLSILSALLLILAFPKPDLGFLAWFALAPLFFALQGKKPKSAFFLSYLTGIIFFAGILYWIGYVSIPGCALLVLYLGLYFAAFGLLFSITNHQSPITDIFLIPCLWVALEYLRSHFFTGFGWALLGYSQYRYLPLIQISDITGAYGVSFLIVLVNVLVWRIWREYRVQSTEYREQRTENRRKRLIFVICTLLSVLSVLCYGYYKIKRPSAGEMITVSVVQGNIPQTMKWDEAWQKEILEKYIRLTKLSALKQPQLIIWPETSVPGFLENDAYLLKEMTKLSKDISPAYLLAGTPQLYSPSTIYNSAALLQQGEIIQRYDKVHLVPFGEFVPLKGLFGSFSFASLIGGFTPGEEYTVFELASHEQRAVGFSTLICFEDVFPHLARRFVRQGAQFLVNITNDAWFYDSSEPYQHLQASVFRAVENRLNVVRSANTGVSGFIDPCGRILSLVRDDSGRDLLVEGERTEQLQIAPGFSLYTKFGDVFALFCLLCISFSAIVFFRRRLKG